ncbi:DUF4326 domain-containing protein [Pseudomonas putida]|uniref:DUF4326 domain-containing protein n=1 Tax=Pseudomonas putida TaxID=303 RepID=A0A8I1EB88_PSEPU|nr:DUF4326 domain-containing protein [Pseudomonas putida]MBI6882822.1 DUF4326 domain-containing protein [Pseudomonas putida]
MTRVVNTHKEKCSRYIGRSKTDEMHFGNPFFVSTKKTKLGKVEVASLRECLLAFNDWLDGTRYTDVEPERRAWILENLEQLRGQTLGCFCKPKPCHGDIYRVKLGEITLEEVMAAFDEPAKEDSQISLF